MPKHTRLSLSLLVIALAVCFVPISATAEYREIRDLALDAEDLRELEIRAGAGSLDVRGVDGLERIEVEAEIIVRRIRASKGPDYIADAVTLNLKARDSRARLVADSNSRALRKDWSTTINLVVRVPARMALDVDDDSGSLEIEHIRGGVRLDDDSGDARLSDIGGGVIARDDSGSLFIEDIEGAVEIFDDSGSVLVQNVTGSVEINDDSGDISIEDITGDVYVVDDSGDIRVEQIHGNVTIDDDSGDVVVVDVSGNLEILDDGSGDLRIDDVQGEVRVDS